MKLEIDTDTLDVSIVDSHSLVTADFDTYLHAFLQHEEDMEMFKEALKDYIIKAIGDLGPGFSTFVGEKTKIQYSPRGVRYKIDGNPELHFTKSSVTPNTEAIDEYLKKHRHLPDGIIDNVRAYSLTLTIKK